MLVALNDASFFNIFTLIETALENLKIQAPAAVGLPRTSWTLPRKSFMDVLQKQGLLQLLRQWL